RSATAGEPAHARGRRARRTGHRRRGERGARRRTLHAVSVIYADTSALVRAYFAEEPEHDVLRRVLLEGTTPVVSSELAWIEFASAVSAASRHARLRSAQPVVDRFACDCADDDGPLTLLRLDPAATFPLAHRLVAEHRLR